MHAESTQPVDATLLADEQGEIPVVSRDIHADCRFSPASCLIRKWNLNRCIGRAKISDETSFEGRQYVCSLVSRSIVHIQWPERGSRIKHLVVGNHVIPRNGNRVRISNL